MKKYLFILGLVGTALFTACSTSDDLISEKPIETPPVEEPKETALIVEASQNSDVSIALVAGQSRGYTRAPIDPTGVEDGYGYFKTEDGRYLGVFCLATGTQEGVPVSNLPTLVRQNKWKNNDESNLVVRMSNVPAKVAIDGNVTFMDPDNLQTETPRETPRDYYYPEANWMKYNFYAYYPYDNSATLNWGSDQVQVNLTIDGSQDVIWGMANPLADNAFSAKYILNNPTEIPQLKFEHKLVLFRFFVKADDDVVTAARAKVTKMDVRNVITNVSLIVANKNDITKNGTLTLGNATGTLNIKKDNEDCFDGTDDKALTLSTTAEEVGYIMLPAPPSGVNYTSQVKVVYTKESVKKSKKINFTLKPSVGGIAAFDAGKTYDIFINIKSSDLD